MEPRISLVTLAVDDLGRSREFYVVGLGWEPAVEAPGVVMIKTGQHLLFSLWDRSEFEEEVGPVARGSGVPPISLAHNVASRDEVDAVLATARSAGASHVSLAVERRWGGYSGYFADPGYRPKTCY